VGAGVKFILSWMLLSFSIGAFAEGLLPISKQILPNPAAISSWQEISGYRNTSVEVMSMARIPLNCTDSNLYPTHPQQNTKLYHIFRSARYDQTKLIGADEACALSSKYPSASGTKACLRPDYLEYAVISDVYRDSCGNFYRGVWDVAFLKANDNMGVLFSKGRTLYQKPEAGDALDMYVGGTYAVGVEEFLFLSPILDTDLGLETSLEQSARATHQYENLIWKSLR
jgi:hypothetical protein